VGSDGSLHGYAYGLARKRQLLDAEAGAIAEAEPTAGNRVGSVELEAVGR
jgi:hypothetical protein